MNMVYLITLATFFSTLLGGLFALYLRDRLHLVLGFSAGAVIGVAFFDLLPESLNLTTTSNSSTTVLSIVAAGFALYLLLDRIFLHHGHSETEYSHEHGVAGAGSLSFHSFLDGIGIGIAFQVAPAVGVIVAVAVLTHDFSDGINTVSLILINKGKRLSAFRWLLVDATAPMLGVLVTRFFVIPAQDLGLLLALFAGFFLYIGATDLIPESYHAHPVRWTTFMTLLGIATLYVIIKLASI